MTERLYPEGTTALNATVQKLLERLEAKKCVKRNRKTWPHQFSASVAREVLMAEALVESLSAAFEPNKYRDNYREQVLDLIERKAAGEEFELPAATTSAPAVVDLMAALEASVKAAKNARMRHPAGGPEAADAAVSAAEVDVAPKRVRKSA